MESDRGSTMEWFLYRLERPLSMIGLFLGTVVVLGMPDECDGRYG